MIIGGAQENTLLNCEDLSTLFGDDVLLITGPSIGPEGDLLGDPAETANARVRPIRRRSLWHPEKLTSS